MAELGEDPAPGLPDERYRSHRAVGTLLALLANRRPLVLALDDVQWADDASIELLSHLLRRRPSGPVLLAFAYRPRQIAPGLLAALGSPPEGATASLDLRPLGPADVDKLLGRDVPEAERVELHRESGGNPFYLQELLRAGRTAGRSRPATEPWTTEVPEAVTGALASELRGLSSESRAVLEGAAVLGDPFDPELAAIATDVDRG